MIGDRERRIGSIGILANHRNVLFLPHQPEAQSLQGTDDLALGRIDGKFGH